MTSLVHEFLAVVRAHPQRVALIDGKGKSATYAELARRSAGLARAWRTKGIGSGDRVILAMPLGIDLYASLAALWRLGAVAVLPEPAMGLAGLRHAARVAEPKAYLSQGFLYRLLGHIVPELRACPLRLVVREAAGGDNPIIEADPERVALLSFTSGSTGAPKGIARTHAFLAAQGDALRPLLSPGLRREVDLVAFPVFALLNLALGVTSVLPPWDIKRPDALDAGKARAWIERWDVTRLLVQPAVLERLSGQPLPGSVHRVFTGGGPVYPDLVHRLRAPSPALEVVSVYGSTEAEPIAHVLAGETTAEDRNAMIAGEGLLAGHPVPEVRVRIVDDEIQVAGGHVVRGYLDPADDASTKVREDGVVWHRTGDAGRLDAQGRLWLLGRVRDRIAGLYPFQVEVAARMWPGVRKAALTQGPTGPVLAIEGDPGCEGIWRDLAASLPPLRLVRVSSIPMDKRHRSKVDVPALKELLDAS